MAIKKLAKRVICATLAGTLAFSGVMPFENNKVIIKADSGVNEKNNVTSDLSSIRLTDLYEWCSYIDKTTYSKNEVYPHSVYHADVHSKHVQLPSDQEGNQWYGDYVVLDFGGPHGNLHGNCGKMPVFINVHCESQKSTGVKTGTFPTGAYVNYNGKNIFAPAIEIGSRSLKGTSIETIIVPETYLILADFAFSNRTNKLGTETSSLKEIKFMNADNNTTNEGTNLKYIGKAAFAGCSSLLKAILPAHLLEAPIDSNGNISSTIAKAQWMGTDVYRDCTSLTDVEIPAGNNIVIPEATFAGCYNIKNIITPDKEKTDKTKRKLKHLIINQKAFAGAGSYTLEQLIFNCDVTLGDYAFSNNGNLKSVTFNGNVEFKNIMTYQEYFNNGNKVENTDSNYIFSGSFSSNTEDEKIIAFNSTEQTQLKIPAYCFSSTGYLNKIIFPNVESVIVDKCAFESTGIKTIEFTGKKVTINENGLGNLTRTDKVVFNNTDETIFKGAAFEDVKDINNVTSATNSLKEIEINSKSAECSSFSNRGTNVDITYGNNVEKIRWTTTYSTGIKLMEGVRNVYITNPSTYVEKIYTSYNIPNEDYTLYGFSTSNYYQYIATLNSSKIALKTYFAELVVNKSSAEVNNELTMIKSSTKFEDCFDASKLKVEVLNAKRDLIELGYSEDGSTGYTLTPDSVTRIKDALKSEGESNVTIFVTYSGIESSIVVKFIPKKVTDFTIGVATGVTFLEGTTIKNSDFTVTDITYNDDEKEVVASKPEDITVELASGKDSVTKNTNNKDTVIVTYQGKSKTFDIDVVAKSIIKLTAKLKNPSKTYCAGSQLTSDDFIVTAEYNNGEKKEDFKDYTISTNTIPNTATAGTPYVVEISAGNISSKVAIEISTPKIIDLIVSYTGAGVLEGDNVDKNNVKVTALYDNLTKEDLKPEEYMLVYEPIIADVKNQVKVVYLADSSVIGTFEVTGLKRTQYDPTVGPAATPTVLPTTSTAPTVVPTNTPNVTPTVAVPNTTVPPVQIVNPDTTTVPPTQQPAETVNPDVVPNITVAPEQTVNPDIVPNVGATKLEKSKYTLGLKEKVTIKLTGGNATNFISSNTNVATVTSEGVVKATKVGTTTIYVTDEFGTTKAVQIIVKKAPKKVKASVSKKVLKVGKKFKIKAKFTKGYYSNKITFTSSNKKVATVNKKGVITAKKKGKTTITLKTYNGKKVKVTVIVK